MKKPEKNSITVILPAGQLPLDLMETASALARTYRLRVYLSTAQNLRLTDAQEEDVESIKDALAAKGAVFKAPGRFPKPRICAGKRYCIMGKTDTEAMSEKIVTHFKARKHTKPKLKIAIAGCGVNCSNPKLADFGVVATAKGFDLYVGGKGGSRPVAGIRIATGIDEDGVLAVIEKLVDFHDRKTEKKQRLLMLLDDPEFPYSEV